MKMENIIIQVKIIPEPKEFRLGCPDLVTVMCVSSVCVLLCCIHMYTHSHQKTSNVLRIKAKQVQK